MMHFFQKRSAHKLSYMYKLAEKLLGVFFFFFFFFFVFTHLCRMDPSTSALWTGPFPIYMVSIYFYYQSLLNKLLDVMKTV